MRMMTRPVIALSCSWASRYPLSTKTSERWMIFHSEYAIDPDFIGSYMSVSWSRGILPMSVTGKLSACVSEIAKKLNENAVPDDHWARVNHFFALFNWFHCKRYHGHFIEILRFDI